MTNFLSDYYLLIKAFHLIAIISWMAGMLYLPRLFVYHAKAKKGSELSETLKIMERKLLRLIMNPAMVLAFIFGIMLIIITKAGAPGSGYWMHAKIFFVIVLLVVHHMLARHRKAFANDKNTKSEKYYRILNEIPTIALIMIVLLVVLKPF